MNGRQAKQFRRQLRVATDIESGEENVLGEQLVEQYGMPRLARTFRREMARLERKARQRGQAT